MKLNKKYIIENIKTIFYALLIAIIIRSLFFQPFYIPSSSMEPTLLVGDRLFVTKYSYGYSKHSFPFSPNITEYRFLFKEPKRGDVVVFKTPTDNRTDYIKRLIGLPGDIIQTDYKTSEMIKYLSNVFFAVKVSFVEAEASTPVASVNSSMIWSCKLYFAKLPFTAVLNPSNATLL